MRNLQTLDLLPILALASLIIEITGSVSLHPVMTGPHMAYLGSRVAFRCIAPDSPPPVTYELMRDGAFLLATGTDLQGNQRAPFFLKVTTASAGSYHCRASTGGSTEVSNVIDLSVVTPPSNTRVTSEPFPPVAYESSRLILKCTVARGSHLSYTWFFNRKEVTSSTSSLFLLAGNTLVVERLTPEHAGFYSCTAWSMVHDTRRFSASTEVQVTVKVYVSKPKISFSIYKEGDSYRGNVTCWSTRGSYPVNLSLSVDDKEVGSVTATESLTAWFPVAMVPGLDMGAARCRVKTEMQELMSEPVTLEVVPVGGDVNVEVEYLYGADSKLAAARLRCLVSRGTFPHISWLLNDTALPSTETHMDAHSQSTQFHFAFADNRRTLVLTKLDSEESEYYRCRVRDDYEDSGPWVGSGAVLVRYADRSLISMPQATPSTETPPKAFESTTETIAIAFCCFLLLMMAVGVACIYRMFDPKQAQPHIDMTNPQAIPLSEPCWSGSGEQQAENFSADYDV